MMTADQERGLPVIRAWRSDRFRLVVASTIAIVSVLLAGFMLAVLTASDGIPLEDFVPYYGAALRMGAGESPYYAEQLESPIHAVCIGCYIYPPMLAQVLVPLTAIPLESAKIVWFGVLALAGFGSAWIGASIGGARPSLERVLWTVAATALFFPIFHSNWLGNVSTLVALCVALVALGGIAGGAGAAFAAVMKVSPLVYVPIVFLADARARVTVVIALLVLFVPLMLLAPSAWADTPQMLLNLVRGEGDVYWNLAPAAMAGNIGWSDTAVSVVRGATLVGGVAAMLAAMWMARRPGGLPLATLLATVTLLLIPGTFWYHYLAVLLPLAAMAWPRSAAWAKLALLGGAVVTSLAGLNSIPIGVSFFSAALMLLVAGWALWPRPHAEDPYHRLDDHDATAGLAGDA